MKGTVKRWLDRKGYGFIEPEGGGDDIFIHHSQIQGTQALREGQEVEFDVREDDRGKQATNLKIIE
jgi:CspA family cold shock protein